MTFLNRMVLAALFAVLPFISSAQFVALSSKIGLGHQFYFGDIQYDREGFRMAPVLGLGTAYKIAKDQSLKLELYYGQERRDRHYKNVVYFTDFVPGPSKYTTISQNHLLVLPFSYQESFGAQKKWFWTFGAYVSFLAMAQTTYIDDAQKTTRSYVPEGHRWGKGLQGGIGIKLPVVGKHKISLELQNQLALKDNMLRWSPWLLLGYEFGLR